MKKRNNILYSFVVFLGVIFFVSGMKTLLMAQPPQHPSKTPIVKEVKSSSDKGKTEDKLKRPVVSLDDWELILVNRDYPTDGLSPELAVVGNVYVASQIAEATSDFLAAAQEIDPAVHLVTGYQSVDYQTELYNYYLEQEVLADPELTEEEAIKKVETYCHPPRMTDHHTGLAIDMSTVDMVNQGDKATMSKIVAMAPNYGFILRYPKGKESQTGFAYEDWHFRYVGVDSAKYMKKHQLTLEEYLEELKETNQ